MPDASGTLPTGTLLSGFPPIPGNQCSIQTAFVFNCKEYAERFWRLDAWFVAGSLAGDELDIKVRFILTPLEQHCMDAFADWVEKLDRLIELRGKGRKFDELLTATALEAAYVDHTLMLLVMSGDFEIAKEWVRKSSTTEKRNDK